MRPCLHCIELKNVTVSLSVMRGRRESIQTERRREVGGEIMEKRACEAPINL